MNRDYVKPKKAFEFGPKIGSIASLSVSYEEDVLIAASLSKGKSDLEFMKRSIC
jgi:hypothetical protein